MNSSDHRYLFLIQILLIVKIYFFQSRSISRQNFKQIVFIWKSNEIKTLRENFLPVIWKIIEILNRINCILKPWECNKLNKNSSSVWAQNWWEMQQSHSLSGTVYGNFLCDFWLYCRHIFLDKTQIDCQLILLKI